MKHSLAFQVINIGAFLLTVFLATRSIAKLFRLAVWSLITPILTTVTFFIIALSSEQRNQEVYIQRVVVDGRYNTKLLLVVGQYLFLFNTQYYFLSMAKVFKFLSFVEIQKRVVRSYYLPILISSSFSWIIYIYMGSDTPDNIMMTQFQDSLLVSCLLIATKVGIIFSMSINNAIKFKNNLDILCDVFMN